MLKRTWMPKSALRAGFAAIIVFLLAFGASCGKGKGVATSSTNSPSGNGVGAGAELASSSDVLPVSPGLDLANGPIDAAPAASLSELTRGAFRLDPLNDAQRFDQRLAKYYRLSVKNDGGGALVEVAVKDVQNMKFALFELYYDPDIFSPVQVDLGDFLGGADDTVRFSLTSIAGKVPVGIARVNYDVRRGVDGSGLIATIKFERKPFGGSRGVSKAPMETENAVLLADGSAFGSTGRFSEKNRGDYDNNGEVGVADITSVAIHYLQSATANIGAKNADGDGSGEVGVADITPIAMSYLNKIAGYHVYRLASPTPPAPGDLSQLTPFLSLQRPAGLSGEVLRPVYSFDDTGSAPDIWYAVAPHDGEGNTGLLSNVMQGAVPGNAPQVTITSPSSGANVSGLVSIAASVNSTAAISQVEFFIDDVSENVDASAPFSFDWDTSAYITEQTHTIKVVATDEFARIGEAEITVNHVFFDLSLTPASGYATSGGSVTVEAVTTYTEALTVEFFLDDVSVATDTTAPYTYDWNADASVVGPHEIRVDATDAASHLKQESATYVKKLAVTLPPVEWQTALSNVTLGPDTPGMADVFGAGIQYGTFTWVNYNDMATMLPTYWNLWYAATDGGPTYMLDKGNLLAYSQSLEEIIVDASNESLPTHHITDQTPADILDPLQPLAAAIADFVAFTGGTPDQPSYQTAIGSLSLEAQRAIAPVFYAASFALNRRNTALAGMGFDDTNIVNFFNYAHGDPSGGYTSLWTDSYLPGIFDVSSGNYFFAGFTYEAFFEGAAYLADTIDDLTAFVRTNPSFANVSLDITTPNGRVTISGTGNDTHAAVLPDGHAILIDLGGNDTYNCHAGGTASGKNGVAICIDFGGDDVYNRMDDPNDIDRTQSAPNDNTSQQGAGRFGIGMLIDYGGTDQYHAVRLSQGSAVFGVGVLADYGTGNDTYETEALGQGGAIGGVAILLDAGGSDSYTAWQKSQGFGGLSGIGYLVDQGFDVDTYLAVVDGDPAKPEYWRSGTTYDSKNMSSCQGCGWGSRWGWIEDIPTPGVHTVGSGGLGILCDAGGDDQYTCGVFGQGDGFYQGVGLLIDMGGNDTRHGHWYTQGATAHAAVGGLLDAGGNDSYTNEASIGIGGAHDWSVTWFCDLGGNDIYNAAGLGLGCGYSNGFGYFFDIGGDDSYTAQGGNENATLGKGNLGDANRPTQPSYGVFLDLHGADTYDPVYQNMTASTGLPGDGQSWIRTVDGTYVNGKGSGLDVQ